MSWIDPDDPDLVVEVLAFSTGPWNTEPDPLYFELKDQIDGMCLVITSWIEQVGDHRYTKMVREDLEELNYKLSIFLRSLEVPVPDPNYRRMVPDSVREYWVHLKKEFADFKRMVGNLQEPTKRLRRTPSGDEAPEAPATGSSSQSAPIIEFEADDKDRAHHGQPS